MSSMSRSLRRSNLLRIGALRGSRSRRNPLDRKGDVYSYSIGMHRRDKPVATDPRPRDAVTG